MSRLLGQEWVDAKGVARSIEPKDVIVVSPYNVQVGRLGDALPDGILVGTVDKIQGKEAPVVIYSMATSTPDDMPRDMSLPLQPQPVQRRHLAGAGARRARVQPGAPDRALQDPRADAPGERDGAVRGAGGDGVTA